MKPVTLITPALLAAAFGISFFFHGGHDITYAPPVFLILAAGLISIIPALKGQASLPRGACVLLTLAFWVYVSISLIWSSVPFASLVTWLNLTVLPLILLTLLCHPDRTILIRHTALALMTVTAFSALYVLWQFFAEGLQRAPGLMPNPNNMAAIINLSLLPVLAYVIAGDKRHRMMAGVVSALLFSALLATGSRGGLLCFVLGALVIGTVLFPAIKAQLKPTGMILVGLAFIFGAFLLFANTSLETSLPGIFTDHSTAERLAIWQGAFAMLRDHLFAGTGLGTFYLYYPSYRLDSDTLSMGHWAHFDALQFGIECGILALILFYAAVGAWLVRSAAALVRIPHDDPRRVLTAGCLAALLALTIHAHIEFQFYIMANLIMIAVLMAALYVLTQEDHEKSFIDILPAPRERLIWQSALVLVTTLVAVMTASTASGYYFLTRAATALDSGDLDSYFSDINHAYKYAPRSFSDADVQMAGFYLDLLAQKSAQMTDDDRLGIYNDALKALEHAQAANPAWADIDHKRAKLYVRAEDNFEADRLTLADQSWREALRKDPLHFHAREEYAIFLIKQGKAEEAYTVIQDALHRPMTDSVRSTFSRMSAQLEPLVAAKRQFQQQQESAP